MLCRARRVAVTLVGLGLFALTGCAGTRSESGAALAAGQSATLRLFGPSSQVEIRNTGTQAIEYTIAGKGGDVAGGTLYPGNYVAESRSRGGLTVTITNPGPDPAQAILESRSRNGMEFRQPGDTRSVDSP